MYIMLNYGYAGGSNGSLSLMAAHQAAPDQLPLLIFKLRSDGLPWLRSHRIRVCGRIAAIESIRNLVFLSA